MARLNSLERVIGISRRIIRQFRRDRRTLGLVFVVPLAVMTLLYFLMNISPTPPLVAVAALPEAKILTDKISQALREGGRVRLAELPALYREDPRQAVVDGQTEAVIVLPGALAPGSDGIPVKVWLEGSDPGQKAVVLAEIGRLAPVLVQQVLISQRPPGTASMPVALPTVATEVGYVHGADLKAMDFWAPIFISYFVFFFTFLLTVVAFLRERTQGTMERLLASPVGGSEIVLGYLGGFLLFALVQSAIILLFTVYVLKIHYQGSLLSIFLVEALLTVVGVNLGIFLSAFAKNELQAVQFIPIVIIPQGLLAETIWKVSDMPWALRWLAKAMPLTYANLALKDVMLRGASLAQVKPELAALALFGLGALVLGALTLRGRQ
ncbi:MAG: ABC transporter permease [Firmicutes bacterium]|nr:ABC transporter permease [Bacillota bacterium]